MISEGWYDAVEFLYGPVGHTHNGVDATHHLHNNHVGGQTSGDLGHFVKNYKWGFPDKDKRPAASLLDTVYDWKKYYGPALRKLGGFTNTKNDPLSVRGWNIMKDDEATVEVRWKMDPALEKDWRGQDGTPAGQGFSILKHTTQGQPEKETPRPDPFDKTTIEALGSHKMRTIMQGESLGACVEFNIEAAETGVIPVSAHLEDEAPCGEWGRLCAVGATQENSGEMRLVECIFLGAGRAGIWLLPTGPNNEYTLQQAEATENVYHCSYDANLFEKRNLPLVRFQEDKAAKCPMAEHPNNVSHPQIQRNGDRRGEWHGRVGQDNNRWWYSEDIEKAKVGELCVGVKNVLGHREGIYVGTVKTVDKVKKVLTIVPWTCTKEEWLAECIEAQWNKERDVANNRKVYEHDSVIVYFKAMTKKNKFMSSTAQTITDRDVQWGDAEQLQLMSGQDEEDMEEEDVDSNDGTD